MKMDEKPKWMEEDVRTREPDITKIKCRTCKFRMKPVTVCGETVIRSGYGSCDIYENKPQEVLWENKDCDHYVPDSETQDDTILNATVK